MNHLACFGVVSSSFKVLSFCKYHIEDALHTFIHCSNTTVLWYNVANMWKLSFVCPPNIKSLFDSWVHVDLPYHHIQPWRLAFYAFTWLIWISRNRIIFYEEEFNPTSFFVFLTFQISLCVVVKNCLLPLVSDICCSLDDVHAPLQPHAIKINISRILSSSGCIKINIDGSFSTFSKRSRIGETLLWSLWFNHHLYQQRDIVDSAIITEVMASIEGRKLG